MIAFWRRWWHVHIVAVFLLAGVAVSLLAGGAREFVKVRVGGPHGTPTVVLTVPQAVVAQADRALADHKGSRDQTPAGAPPAVLHAAQAQDAGLAANDNLPRVFPDAAPQQRGCSTRLVRNYSSRNGVAPRAFVLHYTVSANRPGWSDVDAVVGIFDTWSYQASSNYVVDGEGNCAYIVRESDKAWTQAAANPVAISVEVIATGTEAVYIARPGLRKLAMVISDALARWRIPLQLGAFTGGVLTRPGVLDHEMLGVAGGGHHDIAPVRSGRFDVAAGHRRVLAVIQAVRAFRAAQTAHVRALTRARLRAWIRLQRAHGASWAQIKTTPQFHRYRALGGH